MRLSEPIAIRSWHSFIRNRLCHSLPGLARVIFATAVAALVQQACDAITFEGVPPLARFSVLVLAPDGHVARTLRANEEIPRSMDSAVSIDWDGRDDLGGPVAPGTYTALLVGNSVQYLWQGAIGNSSRDAAIGGEHVFRAFRPIRQIAVDDSGNAFFVTGYNEQQAHFQRFSMTDPHRPSQFLFDDFTRTFTSVDTDGELVYFANVGTAGGLNCSGAGNHGTTTFIAATRVRDNTQYEWRGAAQRIGGMPGSAGTWFGVDVETNTPSTDCSTADNLSRPERWRRAANGGIAVQRTGNYLFAAHTDENAVHVLDKTNGQAKGEIPVTAPSAICTAADESLWVLASIAGTPAAAHFQDVGGIWTQTGSIMLKFQSPLAIGCNRADKSVAVVDGETMQVRDYDAAGRLVWTMGGAGGYRSPEPDVRTNRFGFVPGQSYIAFLPDGSFWLGDAFNFRNLLFSPGGRELMDQIAYLPASYRIAVDRGDPRRVFAQFLEFAIDYRKSTPGSWTLVRNWKSGLGSDYVPEDMVSVDAGIQRPYLLPNGRTYATVFNFSRKLKEVVELDTVNGLRLTGTFLPYGVQMYSDGALRHDGGLGENCGNPCRIFERQLTGFDAQGNPHWGQDRVVAQAPGKAGIDPVHNHLDTAGLNEPAFPETQDHRLISFNAARTRGFHLGAVSRNKTEWDWRASPSGQFRTIKGFAPFPGLLRIDGSGSAFPIDNDGLGLSSPPPALSYAGGTVDALNNLVVFSYPGEGWNGAEASQFMAFDASGAMLGQFGSPGYVSTNKRKAVPGFAGNPYSIYLVPFAGRIFLYVNDESGSGGIQRWEIKGLDTVRKLQVQVIVPAR